MVVGLVIFRTGCPYVNHSTFLIMYLSLQIMTNYIGSDNSKTGAGLEICLEVIGLRLG